MKFLLIFSAVFAIVYGQHVAAHIRRQNLAKQAQERIAAQSYDASQRPPVKGCHYPTHSSFIVCFLEGASHTAVAVIVSIFINRIVWHDEYAEIDLRLRQEWEDSRLAYEIDSREGVAEVSLPAGKQIWTPGTYISNAKEKAHDSVERSKMLIDPTGYVKAQTGRTIYVPITYGTAFPFLNQRTFKLRLSSYNYPIEDVVYVWANSGPNVLPLEVSEDLMEGAIKFEEVAAGDCLGNYTFGVYPCVDVDVTFSSSTFGGFARIFLPSILLVVASWLHFWVHGSWSVPRTISAAGPFLIFAALFMFGGSALPSKVPSLWCWLAFCLLLTFLSFLEYFLVILCGVRRNIRYVNGRGSTADDRLLNPGNETLEVVYDGKCASFRQNNGLDLISRILFPILFLIWCILYFFVL
ncbi:unnamed protein product, partial [Mesorhabditis belari]|uniref:Neurotransmitter-gated ion-channel ligand-binding domain-containing protein n=1 Tax=Mesorhabditis belari TaxID=2138241 RepID=A0AAF3F4J8_9BILA